MRTSSPFIFLIFLFTKTCQLVSGFALAHILAGKDGTTLLLDVFLFMVGIIVVGYGIKKFLPRVFPFLGFGIVLAMMGAAYINYSVGMVFLAGFFLFLLIDSEARLVHSLNRVKNIPRWVPFLLTFIPVIVSYQFPGMQAPTPILFYIVSSLFAFVASYSAKSRPSTPPPIWMGLGLILFSGATYYLMSHNPVEPEMSLYVLTFVLLFYAGGMAVVYMALDGYLRDLKKTSG